MDGGEEACNAAFERGRNGIVSCYWNGSSCRGCGLNNLADGDCVETCGGLTGRLLVTIDHNTGAATLIGDTKDRFVGLAVDKSGRLLGVTGDGAIVPETLFDLNRDNAFPTLVTPFGNGSDGEVIASRPFDNFLYHGGGCCAGDEEVAAAGGSEVFERLDFALLATTEIPVTGGLGEPTALAYWVEKGVFIWASWSDVAYVTPNGEVVFAGDTVSAAGDSFLDHQTKGLAFVRDVTGIDCDANGALDSCDLQVAGSDADGNDVLDVCDDDTEPPVVTPPGGGGGGPPPLILTDSGAADGEGNFAGRGVADDDELLAELTVSGAVPGTEFELVLTEGTPSDDGFIPGGTFAGFADGVALSRTVTIESDADDGSFAATLAIYFNDEGFAAAGLVPNGIEVHVLDDTGTWVAAGTNIGNAMPPADHETREAAVGQSGFFHDEANERWCFWAVLDHFSTFAVGAAELVQVAELPDDAGADVVAEPDMPDDEPPTIDPTPADDDADGIANVRDRCPGTELGTQVDTFGCPLEEPPAQTEPTQGVECGNGVAPCGMVTMLGLWGMLAGLGLMKFARPRVRRN
ncbi:MAG TPA: hypothetical protein ENI79_05505 [Rhodospirillales bacterium]|nr:hypothetical protein [Rhodospirillales bacterium]